MIGSVGSGQGMLPVYDTTGIVAALAEGASYATSSLLTSCTSFDGTVTYTYDATGQLIGADYSGSQTDESYTYDDNGNRLGATAGSSSSAYVIGTGNRLLCDGTYSYAYDEDGNRTARFVDNDASGTLTPGDTEVSQYAWDSRHRLACVTDFTTEGGTPTQIVHYYYDPENRWIGQTIDADGDGTIDHQTRFVYDGNQIVLQFDSSSPLPPGEGQGEGDAITAADLSHRYLWGPAVDQILADEQLTPLPEAQGDGYDLTTPGPVVWPLADHLGTVRDLATYDAQTATTTVANHRTYDSFGNLTAQTNAAVDCLFAFTGRPFDEATGLQNNTNRWYDAKVGRWMSRDPIGALAGDADLYRYVGNSPTNATDPTGLAWWNFWLCDIGAGMGELAGGVWNAFDGRGPSLDNQLRELKTKRATLNNTLGENFRNIQLTGADTVRRDATTIGAVGVTVIAASAGMASPQTASSIANGKITGYRRHGLNQAIGREGTGVSCSAILDAVKNPVQVIQQSGGRIKYIGRNATVITNAQGEIITTWPNGSGGLRGVGGGG